MVRRLIALAGAGVLAAGTALAAALPAQANAGFYMQLSGTHLCIEDTGHNELVQLSTCTTYYTEVSEGGGWFELVDEYGLALNIGSNEYAYSDSPTGATTEQWFKSGYQFENRHYGIWLNSGPASGQYVFLANDSGNPDAQWGTPGA